MLASLIRRGRSRPVIADPNATWALAPGSSTSNPRELKAKLSTKGKRNHDRSRRQAYNEWYSTSRTNKRSIATPILSSLDGYLVRRRTICVSALDRHVEALVHQ